MSASKVKMSERKGKRVKWLIESIMKNKVSDIRKDVFRKRNNFINITVCCRIRNMKNRSKDIIVMLKVTMGTIRISSVKML